jgi:hypothetical protein
VARQRSFALREFSVGAAGRTANILKRLLVHCGAFNLGLLMTQLIGVGTPRGLQGRRIAAMAAVLVLTCSLWFARNRAVRRPGLLLESLSIPRDCVGDDRIRTAGGYAPLRGPLIVSRTGALDDVAVRSVKENGGWP